MIATNKEIRVLIIDDEYRKDDELEIFKNMRSWIEKNFDDSKCKIIGDIEFNSEYIIHFNPDIVIIDIALKPADEEYLEKSNQPSFEAHPLIEISGIEYCKKVKSNFSNIPVILISNHFSAYILSLVIESGSDGYLWKHDLQPGDLIPPIVTTLDRYKTKDIYFYKKIRELLNQKTGVWNWKQMLNALDAFFTLGSSTKRLLKLWQELTIYTSEFLDIKDTHKKIFKPLIDAESILIASNSGVRDHVCHVGNVFWMGYYLFNSFPEFKNIENLEGFNPKLFSGTKDYSDHINLVWMLSSLFHDIGYLIEKKEVIVDKIRSIYSMFNYSIKITKDEEKIPMEDFKTIEKFLLDFDDTGKIIWGGIKTIITKMNNEENFRDHGIVSAFMLLKILPNEYLQKKEILHAITAIALHNVSKWNKEFLSADKVVAVSIGLFPCAWMLGFCDELQNWGREVENENSQNDPFYNDMKKAFIKDSVVCLLKLDSNKNSQNKFRYNLQLSIQYILEYGEDKPPRAPAELLSNINNWETQKKSHFETTFKLKNLFQTTVTHLIPGIDEPKKIQLG